MKTNTKIIGLNDHSADFVAKVAFHANKDAELNVLLTVTEDEGSLGSSEAPAFGLLTVPKMGTVIEAQKLLQKTKCDSIQLNGACTVAYFTESGDDYEEVDFLYSVRLEVYANSIRFLNHTEEGFAGVFSQEHNIEKVNPDDYLVIEWDINSIVEYDDEIFVTTVSARKVLNELESIEANSGGFNFKDLEELLYQLTKIPEGFEDVAEKLDVRQDYNRCYAPAGVETSEYFHEFMGQDGVTPENIEALICSAESYAEQAYDFIGAMDCAKEDVLNNG